MYLPYITVVLNIFTKLNISLIIAQGEPQVDFISNSFY